TELTPRCPQCAAELESEDSIICLNCGYNNRTRVRMTTTMTIAHNPLDWMIWLIPPLVCTILAAAMIGAIVYIWVPVGFKRLAGDAWWGHFSLQIYASVFAAFAAWSAGKFAFRRFVFHFTPPEKIKRQTGGLR